MPMRNSYSEPKTIPAPTCGITQRRRAAETLPESETWFCALLEVAPDAIVITNDAGRIVLVNMQTEKTFGYERDELLGQPVELLIPERFRRTHVGHRMAYAAGPYIRPMGAGPDHLLGRRKDGSEFPIDVALSALETDAGTFVTAALRDITERKQAEEALRRAREELEGRVERQMLRRNSYGLTFREFTVLHLVAAGRADKEIAGELGHSPLTASKHVANILGKMNASCRTEAGVRAVREGLLD